MNSISTFGVVSPSRISEQKETEIHDDVTIKLMKRRPPLRREKWSVSTEKSETNKRN